MSKLSTNWKDTSPSPLIKLEASRARLFDTVITQDMVGKLPIGDLSIYITFKQFCITNNDQPFFCFCANSSAFLIPINTFF